MNKIGNMRGRLAALLLAGLLLLAAAGCGKKGGVADGGAPSPSDSETSSESTPNDSSAAGEASDKRYTMSNFVSLDLDGNKVDQSYFKDYKLTLILVWSPNSEPCLKILPEIVQFAKEQKENGIGVLGIMGAGVTTDEETAKTKEIVRKAGAEFPNLLPTEELYEAKLSEVNEVPFLFCVDKNGLLLGEDYKGYRSKSDLETIIGFRLKELK